MNPDIFAHPFFVLGLALALILTGMFAGTIAGMFGVGGGIVMVPVLSEIFSLLHVPRADAIHVVVATSLATIVPTSLMAWRAHARHGAIEHAVLRIWGPMIVLGAVAGSVMASHVNGRIISLLFSILVLMVAYRFWRHAAPERCGNMPRPAIQRLIAGSIGGISSLLGIGGGLIGVTALSHCGFTLRRAIGTGSSFGFMVSTPGVLIYLLSPAPAAFPYGTIGLVHPLAVALILPGAIICTPQGAKLAHRLPAKYLQTGFAILLLILGCKMAAAAL